MIQFCLSWFGEFGIGATKLSKLIFLFILITCMIDIVSILWGEIMSWSLNGIKQLVFNIMLFQITNWNSTDTKTLQNYVSGICESTYTMTDFNNNAYLSLKNFN